MCDDLSVVGGPRQRTIMQALHEVSTSSAMGRVPVPGTMIDCVRPPMLLSAAEWVVPAPMRGALTKWYYTQWLGGDAVIRNPGLNCST